jgi:hypothetical protein
MSRYIRLTESDLVEIVKKVIREEDETSFEEPDPEIWSIAMNTIKKDSQDDTLDDTLA